MKSSVIMIVISCWLRRLAAPNNLKLRGMQLRIFEFFIQKKRFSEVEREKERNTGTTNGRSSVNIGYDHFHSDLTRSLSF